MFNFGPATKLRIRVAVLLPIAASLLLSDRPALGMSYRPASSRCDGNTARGEITVRHELDETKIVPLVSELDETHDVVVIDTAGAASQATIFAIGYADLVLVPVAPSSADIVEAIKTVNLIKSASQMMRKEIPTRVVLTVVQPGTNIAEHIEREIAKANLPLLNTRLHRLVAFQEMRAQTVSEPPALKVVPKPKSGPAGEEEEITQFSVSLRKCLRKAALAPG